MWMWMWREWVDFATEYTELLEGTERGLNLSKRHRPLNINFRRGDSVSRPLS